MNYKVFIPESIASNPIETDLYGYYQKKTGIFNIVSSYRMPGTKYLGSIGKSKDSGLVGTVNSGVLSFKYHGNECEWKSYGVYQDIYSRNSGILETSMLSKKTAIIVGCGSVGSYIALELARSGIGRFLLIDSDILEYHNLCRHQCGIEDVGRFKTDAIRDRIRRINPVIDVKSVNEPLEHVAEAILDEFCGKDAIIIGCGDDRSSDRYANQIAASYSMPFVSVGFWERAVVGEIFYWIPGKHMPCCECALGAGLSAARVEAKNHHVYTNETDLEKVRFEPGISVDIDFVSCIGTKLVLDIIAQDCGYIPRLLNSLTQYTLVCNTCNPHIGGEIVEIFSYPLQVTTSLQVGFRDRCSGMCRWEDD